VRVYQFRHSGLASLELQKAKREQGSVFVAPQSSSEGGANMAKFDISSKLFTPIKSITAKSSLFLASANTFSNVALPIHKSVALITTFTL
jgi:hypothetical protein